MLVERGMKKDKRGGGDHQDATGRQDELFGGKLSTAWGICGRKKKKRKSGKLKIEKWKIRGGNLQYGIYLNLAASQIIMTMIGWTGACF